MIRTFTSLFTLLLVVGNLLAQADPKGNAAPHPDRYVSPVDINLQHEKAEVEYFAAQLTLLKAAFEAKNFSEIVVRESAILMAMRNEINQLELKIAANAAQAERRKQASSGQITRAATPEEAPARDPFAEAVTPDEKRFETFQYTLAAFDRHTFDTSKPEDAARDFAKLDQVLLLMKEAFDELIQTRK